MGKLHLGSLGNPLTDYASQVDALCIDQTPSPEKEQQLSMMDLIYSCAWATIVALHGENSDAGLCGVSARHSRAPQGSEWIEGSQLLSLFPTLHQELTGVTYCNRAWTLQEFLLCSRRILFGKHQIHFLCNTGRYCESVDDTRDPGGVLNTNPKQPDFFLLVSHPGPRFREVENDSSFFYCSQITRNMSKTLSHDARSPIPLLPGWWKCTRSGR